MATKPLTPEQKADARRLKDLFWRWQDQGKREGIPTSQEDAAAALGFGQSALSQYLNGKIPLNAPAATKFAKLLGRNVRDFSPAIADEIAGLSATVVAHPPQAVRVSETAVTPGGAIQTDRLAVDGLITMKAGGWFDAVQPGSGYVDVSRSDAGAYVWRVRGDGAHPAVRDGWSVVVSPTRVAQSADLVVLKLRDGRCRLAELLFTRDDSVTVTDVAGGPDRHSINRADIEFLHPVLNIIPSSGWSPA